MFWNWKLHDWIGGKKKQKQKYPTIPLYIQMPESKFSCCDMKD